VSAFIADFLWKNWVENKFFRACVLQVLTFVLIWLACAALPFLQKLCQALTAQFD
jgi:hypothetical protein